MNRLVALSSRLLSWFALVLCLCGGLTAQMVTQGLIAHWRFDEAAGTFVTDSAGRSHGSNPAGTVNQPGISGRSISFAGASESVCVHNRLGDFGAGDFTISTWVNANATTPQDGTLFLHYSSYAGGQGVVYLAMQRDTNRPRFDLRDTTGVSYTLFAPPLALGEWHQFVGVRRQQQMEIWVDGQLAVSTATPGLGNCTGQSVYGIDWVRIGGAYTNANHQSLRIADSEKLNGRLDEMTVHTIALSQAQIQQNYNATLTGLPTWDGLLGHWKLDETSGTAVADATGRNPAFRTGATIGAPGASGGAFEFDGIDDAVIAENWLGNYGEGNFSIGAWVRVDAAPLPSYGVWFHEYSSYGGRLGSVVLGDTGDHRPDFGVRDSLGRTASATSTQPLTPGVWHHVMGVWERGTARLYVNGQLAASETNISVGDVTDQFFCPVRYVRIGSGHTNGFHWTQPFATDGYSRGRLDEVKVVAKALTAAEVIDDMERVRPGTRPEVTIDQPAQNAVLATTDVAVQVSVLHGAATTVASTPAGVAGSLPIGGGTLNGIVTVVGEGPQIVSVGATDTFGQPGGSSVEVFVDATAPAAAVLTPAAAATVGESPVALQVAVTDLTSTTITCGGASAMALRGGGTVTLSVPLQEGTNVLSIQVVDEAGHATQLQHTVMLDTTAPLVELLEPVDGAQFGLGNASVLVRAMVTDAAATQVTSSPAGVAGALPPGGGVVQGTIALVEGVNVLSVTAADATTAPATAAVTVILDTTAPQAAITSPEAGAALRGVVDFDVEASDVAPGSGVARVDFYAGNTLLGQVTTAPFQWQIDTALLADGAIELRAEVYDGLGNVAALPVAVVVDNTPPVVTIAQPLDQATVMGIVPFEVSVADAGSGLTAIVQKVGGLAPTADGSVSYAQPVANAALLGSEDTRRWPDGPVLFEVRAVDAAGNETIRNVAANVSNTVVTTTTCVLTPADRRTVCGVVPLVATIDGPFTSVQILVDGNVLATGTSSPFTAPLDTRTLLDGPIQVEARALDPSQRVVTARVQLFVDNLRIKDMDPDSLNLRSDDNDGRRPVRVRVRGPNVALLLPLAAHQITLNVPGGSPVVVRPTMAGTGCAGDCDHEGHRELTLGFARDQLIAAIRAGIDGGQIVLRRGRADVPVTLIVDGHTIDTRLIEVSGARR